MSWQLVYLWSKKIHRLAMWLMLFLGAGMTMGGLILHREVEKEWLPLFVDTGLIRYWHNQMATPFALVIVIMSVTGFLLWAVPKILAKKATKSQS